MTCNTMGRNGGLGGIVYKKFQPISAAVESVLHIPVKEVHSSTLHHLEGQVLEFYIPRWIRPILSPVVIKNRTYLRLLASEVDYKTQWPITLLERTAVAIPPNDSELIQQREEELKHAQDVRVVYEQKLQTADKLYKELKSCKSQLDVKELELTR